MTGLFGNRSYRLYLAGSVASWAGIGIADVLFLWLIFTETGSPLAVAGFGIAQALPPIAVGLFAGVLADRYDRRHLLVVTSAVQAALIGVLLIGLWAFGFHLFFTLGLVVGLEVVAVLFRPSSAAILPGLVEAESLDEANAFAEASTSIATTVGAAGAAFLVIVFGTYPSLGINLAAFAMAALLLSMISVRTLGLPATPARPRRRRLRDDVREIVTYLRLRRPLWSLTVVEVAVSFFVTMFSTFLVVYTVDVLHEPAGQFGYLIASYTAGFFAGSLLAPRVGVVRRYGYAFVLAVLACGGLLGLLVLVPKFSIALAVLAGLGLVLGLVVVGFVTFIQRTVPSDLLGRYFGLNEMLTWTIAPLGIVVGGLVSAAYGVATTFAIASLGLVAIGTASLFLKEVRTIGYVRPAIPGEAVERPGTERELAGGRFGRA